MDPLEKSISKPETSYIHKLDAEVFYFNENGIMKPSSYQALFAKLAEAHLDVFNSGADITMEYGLAWALISMSIEIKKQSRSGMKFSAYTWYSGKQGPFFRRELVFLDDKEDIMFLGSTFSILLDMETRKVFRKNELPFKLTEPNKTFSVEANHRFKAKPDSLTPCETRKAQSSDLDLLGHVNNRRYGDFAYDALTDDEQRRLSDLKRMDIYFVSEMRKHDSFTMFKAAEDDRITLCGKNHTKEDTAFNMVFGF